MNKNVYVGESNRYTVTSLNNSYLEAIAKLKSKLLLKNRLGFVEFSRAPAQKKLDKT